MAPSISLPAAEFQLNTKTIRRFRTGYVAEFGATTPNDLLYEAMQSRPPLIRVWSTGCRCLKRKLETVFNYLPGSALALEHICAETQRVKPFTQISDYYDARHEALK